MDRLRPADSVHYRSKVCAKVCVRERERERRKERDRVCETDKMLVARQSVFVA